MSQELVNSVNKLTDETSALLQEYVKGNTVLQNSASDAASSAAAAKASETNSVNQANIATQKATEAKQYRDETAAIATGGTATVDPAPGKIPLANSKGKISSGWLTALAFARTKADMDAMRASVNRQCAASGMIHAGKSYNTGDAVGRPINEGFWSRVHGDSVNLAFLGHSGTTASGSSETNYPVFNIAGFPVSLRGLNISDVDRCILKFPQAPDGTDIYDSSGNCRGTGKPTLNLLTEVDPKYGDIAPNVNEAVARAFEGLAGNGDGRLPKRTANSSSTGNWHVVGPSYDDSLSIVNNIIRFDVTTSLNAYLRLRVTNGDLSNAPYEVEYEVASISSETSFGYCRFGGVDIPKSVGKHKLTINPTNLADSSLQFGTYTNSQGSFIELKNVSIRPATEEVVTERVDLSGLEGYLEEITPAKPYIYPYGGINNQATSVDGIATTVDNVRPITYFANFTGDTTSRGRGWNLNELTDEQLLTILQNPYHHVYVIDGKLVQFRVRPRTIAGAGNGDWETIDSNKTGANFTLAFSAKAFIQAQAGLDSSTSHTSGWTNNTYFVEGATTSNIVKHGDRAVFRPRTTMSGAYNGECYFYVLATTLRLNQGAYHPSFNPLGAHSFGADANSDGLASQRRFWYTAESGREPRSLLDCFGPQVGWNGVIPTSGPFRYGSDGTIPASGSVRPDDKRYDAIYPDGQGGVIDRRLSAFQIKMEDYFKAMAKAENGSMRGMEKLTYTYIDESSLESSIVSGAVPGHSALENGPRVRFENSNVVGIPYYVVNKDTNEVAKIDSPSALDTLRARNTYFPTAWGSSVNIYVISLVKTNVSVSGNYLQTDVVGNPANILQVDALKNGWLGSWIPQIPDGTSKTFSLTREFIGILNPYVYTTDAGVSWSTSSGITPDPVTNGYSVAHSANIVLMWNYTAAAKVTKTSAVLPVYGARSGLGPVIATEHYSDLNGGLLGESLMGKVLTASGANTGLYAIPLSLLRLDPATGKLRNVDQPRHGAIPLAAPNNNSPAIKILPHAVSINGQATLGFAWNELKHNGTSWGDDGTMLIISNTGTYNNLNGQSCLYGYAELALPIGWVDNHARFGTQVPGVDL